MAIDRARTLRGALLNPPAERAPEVAAADASSNGHVDLAHVAVAPSRPDPIH